MNQIDFKSTEWYRATPLRERTTSLSIQTAKDEFNTELAQRKLQQWKSQYPFDSDSFFTKRLEINSISEAEFLYLLGEPIESIKARFPNPPKWLTEFEQAFFRSDLSNISTEVDSELEISGFLYAIKPLITQALDKLNQELETLIKTKLDLPFDSEKVISILLENLPGRLIGMLSRTMVLELNVARLQGVLNNDTPAAGFQNFIERLKQHDISLSIFQEYPVLARQITICIEHWLNFSLEFIQHLSKDWEDICSTFSPDKHPGLLVALQGGAGDSHRLGHSVMLAKFESGFQVVYKPKSLSVDVHFQQLLNWLNERGSHPPFRALKILERDHYGWVEFIEAKSCTTIEEIERFYQRQGGYLALFYALEATDFHHENLIASGEHPMMIDLEALFHHYRGEIDSKESVMLAGNQMAYSVLRVGLLPQKIWGNEESEGIDISGFGGLPGQLTPTGVPTWEGMGTDEMKLIRKRVEMPVSQNRPSLNGNDINVLDHTESITTGFTDIYQLLLNYRDELLSSESPINYFAEDEVRVVLRPTDTYGRMLWESFHPDLLRNALDRDRFFDRLWIEIKYRPELEKVIVAEQEDLWQGDIPIFTTRANACDLWTSTNQRIPNFFTQSGLDIVQQRLKKLEPEDRERQIWFIRASLATLVMGVEQTNQRLNYRFNEPQKIIAEQETLAEQLLETACAIADHLEKLALRGEDDATWLGLNLISEKHWSVLPLGIDLYDGLLGVILFLAYLGAVTQEQRYTALAEAALNTVQRQLKQNQDSIRSIGGFSGLGGIIYALTHLGVLWNQPALLSDAESLVERLPALIAEDEQLDIIAGAGGCLASLISLYHCKPSETILAAARQCGDRLLSQTTPMKQGSAWVLKEMAQEPLSGFSHGAAGIAWALLELFALTKEQRFYQAALDAITYERSLFYPDLGNWLDLRELETQKEPNQHNCMTAWCHGAPGIGLARLRCLPYIDNLAIRAEINTAIKTTLEQGFGLNHCLCHGDLGNLELILQASLIINDSQCQAQVNHLSSLILESMHQQGWICGVPLGVETPGLMTGLAGIGYGLLRLAQPQFVPSVLMLEPPQIKRYE